jgi:hypothetical protein
VLARTFVGSSIALAALLASGQSARAGSLAHQPPGVRVWINHGKVYQPAERVQVFFRTEQDAYVTVLRVDTDGRVRVLFPPQPGDSNLVRGGETNTVPGVDDRDAFIVDDAPGVGYVFAVASQNPFAYDAFTENDQWSSEAIASLSDGRIHGDPNASLQDLARQMMPEGYADYGTQLLAYDVAQQPDSSAIALAAPPAAGQSAPADSGAHQPPGVHIWTNQAEAYQHAERVQVFFRTERDAYVTVLRVDTDGRVRVLFPREPGDPNLAHGGETYTIPGVDDRDAFVVDDPPGLGYVFAVASQDPFAYDAFTADDQWSLQTVASLSDGRIHGDPYASLQELVQQIVPAGYADYGTQLLAYDVAQQPDGSSIALAAPPATGRPARAASGARQLPYAIEQRDDGSSPTPEAPLAAEQPEPAASGAYPLPTDVGPGHPYPRFLCYDCHAYTPYAAWNPYSAWCPQFSLAVYYNPLYSAGYGYPARYYGGNNVVYARPGLSGLQYSFRTRAEQAAPYAVYRNRAGGGMQQPQGRGVRGVDVGGVGSVPAPGGRRIVGGGMGQTRQRGVYIDAGRRQMNTPPRTAIGRSGQRESQRYIPQAAARQGSRGAPGYGASQASRGVRGYALAQPRPRGAYMDPGARQRSPQAPSAFGRSYQRESQRYSPQAAPRQGSRGAPGYGTSQGSRSMRGYGASGAPRSGYARGGGSRGSSSPAARAGPGSRGHARS